MLFSIFLLVLGIGLIIFGSNQLSIARGSDDWVSTTGIVIETHISEKYDGNDERTYYTPYVNYQYTVEGTNYTSDDIYVGTGFGRYYSEVSAQGVLDVYPVGLEITVYYDPENPDQCALEPGVKATHYSGIMGGILTIIIGGASLALFVYADYMEKKEQKEKKEENDLYKKFSEDITRRICIKCGQALSAENEFCDECGTTVK